MYAQIVIVGGGVVGATTALLLAKALAKALVDSPDHASHSHANSQQKPILLIDANQPKQANPNQHDSRVFALSPASIKLLEHVGVWSGVDRKADYISMKVWATNGAGELVFGESDWHQNQNTSSISDKHVLGSMVEPDVINSALYDAIAKNPFISTLYDTKVTYAEQIAGSYASENSSHLIKPKWCLHLKTGLMSQNANQGTDQNFNQSNDQDANQGISKVDTPLVIAADGRGSFMRQMANINLDTLDYKKTAICAAIKTEKPHQQVARQVFLPTGPLALLPLADLPDSNSKNLSTEPDQSTGCWQSIVWTLPTNQALDLLTADLSALANASQYELGNVLDVQSIASFPLKAQHATSYVQDGLVLVGDAAHGVHPLAGQGLNLGMLDVAVLTDKLVTDWTRSNQRLWASPATLDAYEQARRPHNSIMMHSFSMLGWLFEAQNYPAGHLVEWLRSEGVQLTSKILTNKKMSQSGLAPLQHFFTQQASGLNELAKTRWG